MKDMNFINLFFAIVWAIVLLFAVVGIFWKGGNVIVAVIALAFGFSFALDYIDNRRLK